MKKFKYSLWNKLKTLHENIKQIEENNPYEVAREWIIDLFSYGISITLIINTLTSWQGWLTNISLVVGCGLLRWLIMDTIENVKKRVKD